jgi:hypothetical protein
MDAFQSPIRGATIIGTEYADTVFVGVATPFACGVLCTRLPRAQCSGFS